MFAIIAISLFFSLSLRRYSKSVWSIMFVQTNREVKMAGYIGQILLGIFMDRDEFEDNKNAKKTNEANIQSSWSIKDLLHGH